jgi:hypothetical protein
MAAVAAFESSASPQDYNPCWVLVGDRTSLFSLDMTGSNRVTSVELPPGIHVLENKPLGEPSAKVDYVRREIGDLRGHSAAEVLDGLRSRLRDHTVSVLPTDDRDDSQRNSKISACCVHTEGYGTRSSMLLRVPASFDEQPDVWASNGPSCVKAMTNAPFGGECES